MLLCFCLLALAAAGDEAVDRLTSPSAPDDQAKWLINRVTAKLRTDSPTAWQLAIESTVARDEDAKPDVSSAPSIRGEFQFTLNSETVTAKIKDLSRSFPVGEQGWRVTLDNGTFKQKFAIAVTAVKDGYRLTVTPGAALDGDRIVSSFLPFSHHRQSRMPRMLFSVDRSGKITGRLPEFTNVSTSHWQCSTVCGMYKDDNFKLSSRSDSTGVVLLRFASRSEFEGKKRQITTDAIYDQGRIGFFTSAGVEDMLRDPEYRPELLKDLQPIPMDGKITLGINAEKVLKTATSVQTVMTPVSSTFKVTRLNADRLKIKIGPAEGYLLLPLDLVWNIKTGSIENDQNKFPNNP